MIDIWAKITRRYEKEPTIAGYDIPNEPWIYNSIIPMWIGEFGAFMKDPSSALWLQDAVKLFAKYQVGWAYWAFYARSESSVLASLFPSS